MSYEPWIAQRLMASAGGGFTRVIIRIAAGAVGLSVAVMLLSLALMTGFRHEITRKMFGFWGHIHISDPRSVRSYEALPFVYDSAMVAAIAGLTAEEARAQYGRYGAGRTGPSGGGVRHIHPYIYLPGIITHDGQMEGIILKGVGDDYDWQTINAYNEGETSWTSIAEDELVISRVTADRLRLKTDDKLILHFVRDGRQLQRRFTIKGVYKTGLEESDTRFALASIHRVRQVLGWDSTQIGGLEIAIDHIEDMEPLTEYIYQDILPAHLYTEHLREKFPSLFEWLQLQNINTVVIIGLMLVVAVINMITVLLILILERTQMIGILKSIGAADRSVRRIFLWFALYITAGGILIGNILGLGLAWLQHRFHFIRLDEVDYYLDYAPVMVLPWHVLAVNAGALIVIGLCLIGPSFLVGRVNPVRTIHFQ